MARRGNARNRIFVKAPVLESPGTMLEKKPSREALLVEIEKLRREVEDLKREKDDLEIMLETSSAHADIVAQTLRAISLQLHESNQLLRAELSQSQRSEAALKASHAELQSLLNVLARDKTDLEILLETTTQHGDIIEELLHDQSIHDPLTGLFNRRYMENALEREIRRAQRLGIPLGLVMSDIDHFQRFNNTYGHEAGDIVLREVGIFLQTHIRNSDIPCRYGGEELMLILPSTCLEESFAKAELLRQAVKQLNLKHCHQPLGGITISLGVACFPDHGQTSAELLKSADDALYRAKALGRDRTVAAELLKPS